MSFRVGIPLIQNVFHGPSGWIAGYYYIKNCLNAIASLTEVEKPEVLVFIPENFKDSLLLPEYSTNTNWLKVIKIPCDRFGHSLELQKHIDDQPCDIYFPFNTIPRFKFTGSMIGWIPDFQYKNLPEFFSEQDKNDRDLTANFLLEHSSHVVCSSNDVAEDIMRFYPAYANKAAVLPFKSILSSSHIQNNPETILKKYSINKKYIYLPNQFWAHKNHKTVFEALNQLKLNGHEYLLICTGAVKDYRNPNYFKELLYYIKKNKLENNIRILGYIDRDDQIQLFRSASVVLQPSLFEGWNTSIEDAKALGKTLIISDLPIHREQCGESAYYFNKKDPSSLANLISSMWDSLPNGYESTTEANALLSYQAEIQVFAKSLLNLLKSAVLSNASQNKMREAFLKFSSDLHLAQAHLTKRSDVIASLQEEKKLLTKKYLSVCQQQAYMSFLWLTYQKIKSFFSPKLGVLEQYHPRHFVMPMRKKLKQTKNNLPIISIVTPSFNQGKFLERTIKSITDQGYPNLEYIIQDGASEDETIEIILKHQSKFKHWEIVPDKGQSNALNMGFQHATGEIMAYLNSDDLLLPDSLDYIGNYFADHPEIDVIYSHRIIINENDQEIGRWILPPHNSEVLSWADFIPQETLFWRRSIWDKAGGKIDENFKFAMDWDLILRFRDAGAKFARLPHFLGAFRVHEQQKTSAEMSETGIFEMEHLRQRCHGRVVTKKEISSNIQFYLYHHLLYHKFYRTISANFQAKFIIAPLFNFIRFIKNKLDISPKLGLTNQYAPKPLVVKLFRQKLKKKLPSISIVTPIINQCEFLENTILSIIAEKYPSLEYIIANNTFSDDINEIIKRYQTALLIKTQTKNNTLTHAINEGFINSTGEVMGCINSGDILLSGSLHFVGQYFSKNPGVDVIYGQRILIDNNHQEVGRWILPPHDSKVLHWEDYIPQESLFWRRTLWEKIGGELDESYNLKSDWDLKLRFKEAGATFRRVPRFLGAVRINSPECSSEAKQTRLNEIMRIRRHYNKREVTQDEVNINIKPYLLRHLIHRKLYRLGLLRY